MSSAPVIQLYDLGTMSTIPAEENIEYKLFADSG